jgi:hypothetical protein
MAKSSHAARMIVSEEHVSSSVLMMATVHRDMHVWTDTDARFQQLCKQAAIDLILAA